MQTVHTPASTPLRPLKSRIKAAAGQLPVVALEPIDYLARVINGKSHYPPIRLRKRSGPLDNFDTASASATCGIRPADQLLDVGCGCGSLALQLVGYFQDGGGYTGMDVDAGAIRWARRSLSRRDPRLRFELADVKNDQYNPDGRKSATAYTFPFADGRFDPIIAKSLFTHMRPHDVTNTCASSRASWRPADTPR